MASGERASVVLHGHFYQPPRENPWLEYVEAEANAAPFHDWNARIESECYRAVTAARVPADESGNRVARIVNALEWLSFDFGPTLLEWLEPQAPRTYRAVLEADAASRARLGHGNAIAAPYHHVILPLASRRDKVTEVRWGIADFRRRFGRDPEGLWLPETAVDDETLDVLAESGIRFTIVAPHQVKRVPPRGLPGRYRTGGGRDIALIVYDGPLSHDVAFGPLLDDAFGWARRLLEAVAGGRALVALATDGETFGHHHKFGEMALARLLDILGRRSDVAVTNCAAFLAAHPPAERVELVAPSSWSCPHGVERWRADCGCKTDPARGWHQKWRAPLRAAVEWLAAELHRTFEKEGGALLADPWAARDAYGETRGTGAAGIGELVARHAARPLAPDEAIRARELLELEHDALALFTSCAWFFDDIGGLEPAEVLRYGAHAIELAGPLAPRLENDFAQRLAQARSNDPAVGDGRRVFLERSRPRISQPARVAGSFAAQRRFVPALPLPSSPSGPLGLGGGGGAAADRLYCYDASQGGERVRLVHRRTGRASTFDVSVQPLGGCRFAVTVTPAGQSAAMRLGPGDLSELEREAIRRSCIAAIARRALTPEEGAQLCEGQAGIRDVAERGLLARLEALARDRSDAAREAALDLLDLLELVGGSPTFESQTAFELVRRGLPPADAGRLAALAERLGFAAAPSA